MPSNLGTILANKKLGMDSAGKKLGMANAIAAENYFRFFKKKY